MILSAMHFTKLDDSPMFRKQLQALEENAESLRERCQKFYKCSRKYTEGLGEAYDGDIAFASALEAFGGSHDDPASVALGGPVMSKFTIALREIGTYKEVLRSQVEHMLNDRLIQFANIDLQEVKEVRKRFEKASNQYDQVREKFLSLKKGTKADIVSEAEDDVRNARSSFEQARFNLVTTLSNIEAKKKFEFLEAVSGSMDAHLRYFKQGYELFLQMEPYIHQVLTYAQMSRERANYEQASLADKMQEYRRQMELEYEHSFSDVETLTAGGDGIQAVGRSTHKMIEAVMQSTPRGKVQTIKQGYLLKRSSNRRADWKRRYFVLDSRGILYYYRKQWGKSTGGSLQHNGQARAHSSEHNSGLLGRLLSSHHLHHHHHQSSPQDDKATTHHTVNLLTATIKVDAEQSDLRFCFRIVSPSKIYTLQAENAMEQMDWIDKITGVIASLLNAQVSEQVSYSQRLSRSPAGSGHQRTTSESSSLSSSSDFDPSATEESPSTRGCSSARKDRIPRSPLSNMPEQSVRPLDVLRTVPGNDVCADCNAPDPDWASLNLGILLCIECSGVHRNLGVHMSKVRSLTLDVKVWDTSIFKLFQSVGNSFANSIWEEILLKWQDERHGRGTSEGSDSDQEETDAYLPILKPYPRDSLATKEKYIYAKYAEKQFVVQHKVGTQVAWKIWDAVQKNNKQLVYRLIVTSDINVHVTYEQAVNGRYRTSPISTGSSSRSPMSSRRYGLNSDPPSSPGHSLLRKPTMLNLQGSRSSRPSDNINEKLEEENSDVSCGLNLKGCTLLHLACIFGDLGMIEMLLQYGAKLTSIDSQGRTPLHHCIENGKNANAKFLLSRGASPSAVDKDGKTPLQRAMEIGTLSDEELFLMLSETSG